MGWVLQSATKLLRACFPDSGIALRPHVLPWYGHPIWHRNRGNGAPGRRKEGRIGTPSMLFRWISGTRVHRLSEVRALAVPRGASFPRVRVSSVLPLEPSR